MIIINCHLLELVFEL